MPKQTLTDKAYAAANKWYEAQGIPPGDRNMLTALADMYKAGRASKFHVFLEEWYDPKEMRRYLKSLNYSDEIADELCEAYAKNLNLAYNKGLEKQPATK